MPRLTDDPSLVYREIQSEYSGTFRDIELSRADVEWLLLTNKKYHVPTSGKDPEKRLQNGLDLYYADLHGLNLSGMPLDYSSLRGANLRNTSFGHAFLIGADLREAHLENATLDGSDLSGADLRGAFLSESTSLKRVHLTHKTYGTTSVCDIHWGDTNLAIVNFERLTKLGDEEAAELEELQPNDPDSFGTMLEEAIRANRQLALVLQSQGLNESVARFYYNAHRLQQKLYRINHQRGKWFASCLLNIFAGYGYLPSRALLAYVVTVLGFMDLLLVVSRFFSSTSLSVPEAFVLSLAAALGRGFFPPTLTFGDPISILAVIEGVIALFIEAMLIATFARRFLEG
ncbi:MAG: pentapeptide repeat-containing protein [Nitrososphaerales archaeon]